MILHRYLDEHGFYSLFKCELKVSIPSGINDPFECTPEEKACWTKENFKKKIIEYGIAEVYQYLNSQGLFNNKEDFERVINQDVVIDQICDIFNCGILWESIKEFKKIGDKIYRFICFSSSETLDSDQILLWSHYTNKHKGFRFHFDSNKLTGNPKDISKIIYSDKRSSLDASIDKMTPQFSKQMLELLITKSLPWEYEHEYRLIVAPEKCYIKKGLFFIKLIPESLIQIDLGIDCSIQLEKKIKKLLNKEEYSHINLFRAELAQKEFKFDYVKIK
jgi:hypothetical protein